MEVLEVMVETVGVALLPAPPAPSLLSSSFPAPSPVWEVAAGRGRPGEVGSLLLVPSTMALVAETPET